MLTTQKAEINLSRFIQWVKNCTWRSSSAAVPGLGLFGPRSRFLASSPEAPAPPSLNGSQVVFFFPLIFSALGLLTLSAFFPGPVLITLGAAALGWNSSSKFWNKFKPVWLNVTYMGLFLSFFSELWSFDRRRICSAAGNWTSKSCLIMMRRKTAQPTKQINLGMLLDRDKQEAFFLLLATYFGLLEILEL